MNTYVRSSRIDIPKPVKEDDIFESREFDVESLKYSLDALTPSLRRRMAFTAPFFWKGLTKKSRDTFKAGFTLLRIKDDKEPSSAEQAIVDIFNRRTNLFHKLTIVSMCVGVYGDGFLLMEFDTDDPSQKDFLSKPIPRGAEPRQLKILNPENLFERRYKSPHWRKKKVQHYLYSNQKDGQERFIHPDRILHFKEDELPFSQFGVSKVDILRNIISSTADIDISMGEVIKWFARGIVQVTKEGMDATEKKHIEKEVGKHYPYFVNDEKYEMKIHNPSAIRPKEFYDYMIQATAAVLVMPTHLLQGVHIGKVTGAETSYTDYYNDINDVQQFTYSPELIRMYSILFAASENRIFDYNLIWSDIYINESAEADLLSKRSVSAVSLKGANIIDYKEARQIVNRGFIKLDINKEIDQGTPIESIPKKPSEGSQGKKDTVKQKRDALERIKKVANAQIAIERRKDLFEMSKGERESAIQDKRLEKAFKDLTNTEDDNE